jgi:hypothetical protein
MLRIADNPKPHYTVTMPNILLVDDHPPIRDSLIRNAFPTLGWLGQTMFGDVRQADSFESGIAINPLNDDLAIIDILIPEQVRMTGDFRHRIWQLSFSPVQPTWATPYNIRSRK